MLKLIRSEWQLLLFGFLMTFWSSPGQTYLISLFSCEIRMELGLSDCEFAGIYSLATLASAVVMIWSGTLVDRIDLKKFSIAIVIGLCIGCGLMSVSVGVVSLLVSLFLIRQLGQGLMLITSSTAMVRYLDSHKGKSSALAGMGYAVSEAVMPSILVALLLWVGWRVSWQIAGIVLIAFMVPAIFISFHMTGVILPQWGFGSTILSHLRIGDPFHSSHYCIEKYDRHPNNNTQVNINFQEPGKNYTYSAHLTGNICEGDKQGRDDGNCPCHI